MQIRVEVTQRGADQGQRTSILLGVIALCVFGWGVGRAVAQQAPASRSKAAPTEKKSAVPDTPPTPQSPPARPTGAISVEDVIQLAQAGIAEDLIIAKIKKSSTAFDLSTEQILGLKKAGVSDNIVRVMLDPTADTQPSTPTSPLPPTSTPSASSSGASSTELPPGPTAGTSPMPDEEGVYWLKEGKELVRLEGKAVSNIRSGSRLANWATAGIKRTRINAQLKGPRSENRFNERQPQFCLYLPEEASVGDYLLIRMAQRLDVRQIEIGQSTLWKQQGGIDHEKEVEFTHKRIKPRLYVVTPNRELEPGEYGFFIAAGIELKKPTGRIYDFGIDP